MQPELGQRPCSFPPPERRRVPARSGASLVTALGSETPTLPSLIWTVQPGLRRESPSDASLMACEPCPELGAQSSARRRRRGGALEVRAAGVVNQPTRGPPFVSSLFSSQTAKPVTVRHQGSAVCQHLPADKDRGRKSVGPQRPRRARRVCWRNTASTYVSAQ